MRGKVAHAHGPLGRGHGIGGAVVRALKVPDTGAAFTFIDDRLENGAIVKHAFGGLSCAGKRLGLFVHACILSHGNFLSERTAFSQVPAKVKLFFPPRGKG